MKISEELKNALEQAILEFMSMDISKLDGKDKETINKCHIYCLKVLSKAIKE